MKFILLIVAQGCLQCELSIWKAWNETLKIVYQTSDLYLTRKEKKTEILEEYPRYSSLICSKEPLNQFLTISD
jgi:hypothetical protein